MARQRSDELWPNSRCDRHIDGFEQMADVLPIASTYFFVSWEIPNLRQCGYTTASHSIDPEAVSSFQTCVHVPTVQRSDRNALARYVSRGHGDL